MSQNAEHVLVAGPSGGGKTTFLRELHARHGEGSEWDPSIFMTSKSGERKAVHNPPERVRKPSAVYPGDIQQAREWAVQRPETVQVIVDECQNAPSFRDGEGPLAEGLHEDRSSGVKYVLATQSPQDLHTTKRKYGPIQQCQYWVFVGPAKDWHTSFFQGNGMGDVVPHLPTENYEYVVLTPKAALSGKEKIVHRGETNPKFG